MEPLAGAILAGAVAFAATNVDDLFLLIAFFAAGTYRARDIVIGQYAGIGLLFAASAAASLLALALPAHYLPLLGLAPILIGLRRMFGAAAPEETVPPASGILSVAAVTLAGGGDNIAVYTPLLATSEALSIAAIGTVFALMTALWCYAAWWLLRHPAAAPPVRRYGPRLAPYALIAIGFVVLVS